ncbi:MAG: VanZ family protein [Bacteroidetes bacterium]|nr:VanZ family protein [Bacteroidota bacterium]
MKPFLPVLLWALAILVLSTGAGIQVPEVISSPDKLGHFFAYGILNWLTLRVLHKIGHLNPPNVVFSTLAVSTYGVALELVQWAFFPNRFCEIWDMVANFTGALTGYFAFTFYLTKK